MLQSKTYSIIRGLLAMLVGLCFILWPNFTADLVIKIIAGFLIVVGVVMLIGAFNAQKSGYMLTFNIVAIAASIVLGLLIFIFPLFFLNLIAFLFGIVLIIAGITQVMMLSGSGVKKFKFYITPLFVMLCGMAMFFVPESVNKMIFIFFGALMLLYGISEIVSGNQINKHLEKE